MWMEPAVSRRRAFRVSFTRGRMGQETDELEPLVARAATGDDSAWQALWGAIEPRLMGLVRKPRFLGRLADRDDDCRNVVVNVMARLRDDDFHRLHLYLRSRNENPQLRFMPWLIVVTKRVAVDYLRAHPDYIDRRREEGASTPGAWVDPATLPSADRMPGARPPMTNRGTAMELLRYAKTHMPEPQRRAVELWAHSASFGDIAHTLALDSDGDAERLVRAGLERLRRFVRQGD